MALVLSQPDRPAGRGLQPAASAVKQLAIRRGLPVFQPLNFKSPDAVEVVRAAKPQALVVAAYGLLLPESLLQVAPLGAWNIHASLLPRWRGAAPIQRAILAGDRETGISIMRMDAGLDTGPVLSQSSLPILASDDTGTLHDKLAALGAEMMVAALAHIPGEPQAQASEGVTYAAKMTRADSLLDWSRPAVALERVVRASRPSPGASTTEGVKIWRARVVSGRGAPGEILGLGDTLTVACGEDALAIAELQRPGGKRVAAADYLRGRALRTGERFA